MALSTILPSYSDITPNLEMMNVEVNAVDGEGMFDIEEMVKRYQLKSKILADNFDKLSTLLDESLAALLKSVSSRKDNIFNAMKYACSLKDEVKDIKADKKRQEDTIVSLENDIRILLSACTDATQGLELNFNKVVPKLKSINKLVNLHGRMTTDWEDVNGDEEIALATDHVKKAQKLLLATKRNQDLGVLFQDAVSKLMNMTENMQNELKETQLTSDQILEERDLYKDKILKLETDLKEQQNSHHEMTIKLEDLRSNLKEMQLTCDEALEKKDMYKEKIFYLEADLKAQQDLYNEMVIELEDHRKKEDELRKREAELSTSFSEFRGTLSLSYLPFAACVLLFLY